MAGRATLTPEVMDTLQNVYLLNDKGNFEPAVNPLNRYSTVRKDLSMQRLGPAYGFAKEMARQTKRPVGLVVNARGGSSINSWLKGSKDGYYEEALFKLNTLVGVLKTEVFKQVGKSGKGSKIRFLGEYELCHPLNVAVISGLIAKKLEFSTLNVDQVILAGLLHDIGKLKIELTDSEAMLTMNEDEVKDHPVIGYKMIREEFELPEDIAKVALEHHENNDGSGYPKGLSSDYISEYSQIVNVANFYDNLAFNRTHIMVMNNKEALRTMLEVGTKRFSAKMLYSFIHMFNYDDSKSFNDMVL